MARKITLAICVSLVIASAGCGSIKQSYLDSFVEDEKAEMPKILFAGLEAIDVESGESELIYFCKAQGINDDAAVKAKMRTRKSLDNFVKGNKEKLKSLIDNKIKLTISLQSSTDTELYRLSVNPWEL